MKPADQQPYRFDSLTELHRVFGLPKPLHPLVSLIDIACMRRLPEDFPSTMILNFWKIAYKTNLCGKAKYGQSYYDFGEGGLVLTAPNQLMESPDDSSGPGCLLLVHADFLLSYPLGRKIRHYGFFSYAANEALHLSDKEKATVLSIFGIVGDELNSRIDDLSQDVIVSQLELLLTYCDRYYRRQFITRKAAGSTMLQSLEDALEAYFESGRALTAGIPTVQFLADGLRISPGYLSDMLRALTGQNAQQHIHNKIVEKAKEQLSASRLTVSEIAYQLGFEHPQSFSRLFKTKTRQSPLAFRAAFQ